MANEGLGCWNIFAFSWFALESAGMILICCMMLVIVMTTGPFAAVVVLHSNNLSVILVVMLVPCHCHVCFEQKLCRKSGVCHKKASKVAWWHSVRTSNLDCDCNTVMILVMWMRYHGLHFQFEHNCITALCIWCSNSWEGDGRFWKRCALPSITLGVSWRPNKVNISTGTTYHLGCAPSSVSGPSLFLAERHGTLYSPIYALCLKQVIFRTSSKLIFLS